MLQNGPFQNCIIIYHWFMITDAKTCKQHFNVVVGQGETNCNFLIFKSLTML